MQIVFDGSSLASVAKGRCNLLPPVTIALDRSCGANIISDIVTIVLLTIESHCFSRRLVKNWILVSSRNPTSWLGIRCKAATLQKDFGISNFVKSMKVNAFSLSSGNAIAGGSCTVVRSHLKNLLCDLIVGKVNSGKGRRLIGNCIAAPVTSATVSTLVARLGVTIALSEGAHGNEGNGIGVSVESEQGKLISISGG